jgi:hypothetical protein
MMRVSQNDALAKTAIEENLNVIIARPFTGLIIADNERLNGALIFNNYTKQNIDMTVLSLGPWSITNVRDIARYVFEKLNCKRVSCQTLTTNFSAINRLMKLGFELEGTAKDYFPQGDAFFFGLVRSNQKILRLKNEHTTTP